MKPKNKNKKVLLIKQRQKKHTDKAKDNDLPLIRHSNRKFYCYKVKVKVF
jgi:hypothetical protein